MKVFLPVLLAALLGVEQAHSLVCFSCTNQNSNFYCLKPTVCSDSDNYCVTVSASAGIGERRRPPLPPARASAPCPCPHGLVFPCRETGGLRPYPEQGLLPDLPQPQREPRRGVHRHVLLPELPVQRQHRWPGAARQRRPAGPRAPAQPAVGPAAARALTPQLRKEGPAPPRPRHDVEASSSDPSSCSSPRSGLPPAPPPP
uniref:Snake toxin/toxin-like domain-containing protein n=1 Tax=Ursus americanus TaxID=9643 RepID=A0A452QH48_URSAM